MSFDQNGFVVSTSFFVVGKYFDLILQMRLTSLPENWFRGGKRKAFTLIISANKNSRSYVTPRFTIFIINCRLKNISLFTASNYKYRIKERRFHSWNAAKKKSPYEHRLTNARCSLSSDVSRARFEKLWCWMEMMNHRSIARDLRESWEELHKTKEWKLLFCFLEILDT